MREGGLSIVVCAYNALEYTKLLVASIRDHSAYEHEIVLYSDGSTDGTLAWLREQKDIRWQHDRTNRGICTAMNRAARMATRDYLFFPNTDHVLAPGWDRALLSRLRPRTVVSCQCVEPGIVPVAPIFHARNCGTRWDEFEETRFLRIAAQVAAPKATPGINYPFAISKKLWEEVGGLDERFDPGPANDPDLFYRLALAGAEMIRAEDAICYHFSGKSSRMADEAAAERRRWHEITERNEARFVEKWGERYRYANGGLPDPGPEARRRFGRPELVEVCSRLCVAIDARSVTREPQGVGIYTTNLIRALSRREDALEIHCFTHHPIALGNEVGSEGNIVIHRFDGQERARTEELVARIRPNLFHGPAFSLPEGLSIPSVVTIHDLIFLRRPEWYPPEFVRHLKAEVERSARTARAVIAVSEKTRQEIGRLLGVRATRIYEALPEDFVPSTAKHSPGHDTILSVGVQQRRKNAVALVRAFARLRKEGGFKGRLVLTGGKECEDPRLAGEAGEEVVLAPYVPRRDLPALYSASKLFVYPSLDEGFGLPLLEAMASGVPIVASDAGAIPEVAGDAALLVPPDDEEALARAMKAVLTDPTLAARLVEAGKRRLAEFSWDKAAAETLEVYRKCVEVPAVAVVPRRLRVAVDARMLAMTRTGTGRYTAEILKALAAHAPDAEFVPIEAGPETLLDAAWEQFSLPTHLVGCDVYFSPTGIVPAARSCKAVAVVHDLGFEDRPEDYEPRLRAHLARWIPASCLTADRIVAVSGFTRDRIVARYGIPAAKIRVVHHGRLGRAVRSAGTHILCVSSFEPNKNQRTLVEAFAQLPAGMPKLVLAGRKGRSLAEVQEAARGRNVEIIVDPSDEELARLYAEASLFAFPSLHEGFGFPLVEAMEAGLPIVANRVASIPEVAGDAAVLVDDPSPEAWAEAMRRVLQDDAMREDLRMKSLRRGEDFRWSETAARTWEALEKW